jgi:hypothetical protein
MFVNTRCMAEGVARGLLRAPWRQCSHGILVPRGFQQRQGFPASIGLNWRQ